jgi:hypothetical protein
MAQVKIKKDAKQEARFAFTNKKSNRFVTQSGYVFVEDNEVLVVRAGESVDEFMARTGVFDKLLSQIDNSTPSPDWEAELDELRDRSA